MLTNRDTSFVHSSMKEDGTDRVRHWIEGDNKALVHHWIEKSNKANGTVTGTFIHNLSTPEVSKLEDFNNLFTGYHADIKGSFTKGDRVVVHLNWHKIPNMPSIDKEETFTTISTFRIVNHKIVEFWPDEKIDETVDEMKKEHFRWLHSIRLYGLLLSLGAVTLIIIHTIQTKFLIDTTTLILLFFAILPFLPKLLESAKLPGGWEVTFRGKIETLETEQKQQKSEIKSQQTELMAIKLLINHLVPEYELTHLQNFNDPGEFSAKDGGNFIPELRHLLLLGFIERTHNHGFRTLEADFQQKSEVNVKDHFIITASGKEYLRQYEEIVTEL